MRLTQELPAEMRERLEEEATRQGQEPDTLLLSLVDASLSFLSARHEAINQESLFLAGLIPEPPSIRFYDGRESDADRFRKWADSQPPRGVPVIPLEALDREHVYGNHA